MTMFLGDPNSDLKLYGKRPHENYNSFVDEYGNEYEYDEFVGKWLKKRKERRASKPKVIARRQKRDEKRISKGKDPKYPELSRPAPPKVEVVKEKEEAPTTAKTSSEIKPLTKSEAQAQKNVNKAIQEELKTKQEELKTLGLEKKVAQEDLKAENQKAKTQLASTGKGLLWVVAIVGGIVVLKMVFGGNKPATQVPATAPTV